MYRERTQAGKKGQEKDYARMVLAALVMEGIEDRAKLRSAFFPLSYSFFIRDERKKKNLVAKKEGRGKKKEENPDFMGLELRTVFQ